jgi:hypothetical protein
VDNESAKKTGRQLAKALIELQTKYVRTEGDLLSAMETRNQAEVRRLRPKVLGLRHDIAVLKFELMVDQDRIAE